MNKKLKYLMLPLFCLSLSLSGCNNKTDEIKKEVESSLVGYDYDKVVVNEVKNGDTTIYMVYVYDHHNKVSGGVSYGISVYVWNNGYMEWVYSV